MIAKDNTIPGYEGFNDPYVGYIAGKVRWQELGYATQMISRQPFYADERRAFWSEMSNPHLQVYYIPSDQKWCSCCGDVMSKVLFTRDTRKRDGLHSHCNPCRAKHAMKMRQAKRQFALTQVFQRRNVVVT